MKRGSQWGRAAHSEPCVDPQRLPFKERWRASILMMSKQPHGQPPLPLSGRGPHTQAQRSMCVCVRVCPKNTHTKMSKRINS